MYDSSIYDCDSIPLYEIIRGRKEKQKFKNFVRCLSSGHRAGTGA